MTDRKIGEKEEEKQEKDLEKTEEKSPEEKNWDEKWRRDPVNAVTWAAIFIWAGIVFLMDNLGMLGRIEGQFSGIGIFKNIHAWGLVLIGAGAIVILAAVARLLIPEHRRPIFGSVIVGIVLIGVGLGELFTWDIILPLILIALGVSILARGFVRKT